MPLQKRLPKYGFTSRIGMVTAEIRLSELNSIAGDVVDLEALRTADLINANIKRAKIFLSGELKKSLTVKGLAVTKGAKAAIEAAGGKIEE
jgi:large subunit ribosomal protein L15